MTAFLTAFLSKHAKTLIICGACLIGLMIVLWNSGDKYVVRNWSRQVNRGWGWAIGVDPKDDEENEDGEEQDGGDDGERKRRRWRIFGDESDEQSEGEESESDTQKESSEMPPIVWIGLGVIALIVVLNPSIVKKVIDVVKGKADIGDIGDEIREVFEDKRLDDMGACLDLIDRFEKYGELGEKFAQHLRDSLPLLAKGVQPPEGDNKTDA